MADPRVAIIADVHVCHRLLPPKPGSMIDRCSCRVWTHPWGDDQPGAHHTTHVAEQIITALDAAADRVAMRTIDPRRPEPPRLDPPERIT